MKYIKKFNNEALLDSYKKSNFVAPHIYLDSNLKTINFMQKYERLEYISSTQTGGQYIDLGCKLMENTDDIQMYIKFNVKGHGKDNQTQSTFIGCQLETSPYPGIVLRKDAYGYLELQAKWEFTGSYKESSKNNYKSGYLSHPTTSGSNTIVYKAINNIYEFSETFDNIPATQCHQMNVHLFCALDGSNKPFRFVEADLYYLKFTKGGQVIRNLIPVKKVATNEIGLYDIENDHLYVSQGDDPFVAGPTL